MEELMSSESKEIVTKEDKQKNPAPSNIIRQLSQLPAKYRLLNF